MRQTGAYGEQGNVLMRHFTDNAALSVRSIYAYGGYGNAGQRRTKQKMRPGQRMPVAATAELLARCLLQVFAAPASASLGASPCQPRTSPGEGCQQYI